MHARSAWRHRTPRTTPHASHEYAHCRERDADQRTTSASHFRVARRYFTERTAELSGEAWHAFANELNTRISELVSSSAPHEQVR